MSGEHILVVDDDRLVLSTLADGLRAEGFDVSVAESAAQAIGLCDTSVPHLVIVDARMPEVSGIELAAELGRRSIPFLFLSAHNEEALVRRAVAEGALGYLLKPIDIGRMLPSICAALQVASNLRDLETRTSQLKAALESDRHTSVSVGLLMERFRLSHEEAFETLRAHARAKRRRLQDVARDLVGCADELNRLAPSGRKPTDLDSERQTR